jgi:hypothetical protein
MADAALPNDPVIVLIEDDGPTLTLEEWLALVDEDEPTETDVGAAELIREFRERGES